MADVTAKCSQCPAVEELRVINPRVPGTAGSFMAPEIRCRACCAKIRGEFRLRNMTVAYFLAQQANTP